MARRIPDHRFADLISTACEVFISQGYRRTQMADIAEALGVAKGTLYGYVESKEALFYQVARHADQSEPPALPRELPVSTPKRGEIQRLFRDRLSRDGGLHVLRQALARARVRDLRSELEGILRELYSVMERNHRTIKLIDRCSLDHPELAELWQREGREGPRELLARYLRMRARSRRLRSIADPTLTARLIIETITTWTVHIKWDRFPQRFEEKPLEDTIIAFLLSGLLADPEAS